MKTNLNATGSGIDRAKSAGSRIIRKIGLMLVILLSSINVFSQTAESTAPTYNMGIGFLIFGMIAFLFIAVYMIFNAKRVLEQNGRSLDFSFSSLKWSAKHNKAAGVIMFLIVMCGILWAISYGS